MSRISCEVQNFAPNFEKIMDSFKIMPPAVLRNFMAGEDLTLQAKVPHHIVKKYPSEVMVLQHQYDQALNAFNKRIKKLQKENKKPKDEIVTPENRKAVLFKMNKDRDEGRCN